MDARTGAKRNGASKRESFSVYFPWGQLLSATYYSWYHESKFGFDFFFFSHVAISDSVQWLPYLGFVPGPTRTTSKGLISLLSFIGSIHRYKQYTLIDTIDPEGLAASARSYQHGQSFHVSPDP